MDSIRTDTLEFAEASTEVWSASFRRVRRQTEELCAPLEIEDYVVQPHADVSPAKWHLGHTTWFFETFLLRPHLKPDPGPWHEAYGYLFNSYYNGIGSRVARSERGHHSRPTVQEVYAYRAAVNERVLRLLESVDEDSWLRLRPILELGLHHEQQHQELLLMDLKWTFHANPLSPAYRPLPASCRSLAPSSPKKAAERQVIPAGLYEVGAPEPGFAFDHERPVHRVYLDEACLEGRLVTCGEFAEFVADGGYAQPALWLSDGWDARQSQSWDSPHYWKRRDGQWFVFGFSGWEILNPDEPVSHISFFEAEAFARWAGRRLPTEFEWEVAARRSGANAMSLANVLENDCLRPLPAGQAAPGQFLGDLWEWTGSAFLPYPGYRQPSGVFGEYNGKFMNGQRVLRGGSFATPQSHLRLEYRNFFQPDKRWPFTGLRLA